HFRVILDDRDNPFHGLLSQIGVTKQSAVQQLYEMAALFDRHFSLGNPLFQVLPNPLEYLRPLVLDIFEALPAGIPVDDRIDHVTGSLVESYVYRIGIAEKVMQVSQDLLIGPDQEEPDVVLLVLADLVEGQKLRPTVLSDKTGYLAIRIAGDISDGSDDIRLLVQTLDREYREKLVDSPRVGNRLEQREVGKIGLPQGQLEVLQLLRDRLDLLDDAVDLFDNLAVEPLCHSPLLQGKIAEIKKAHRLLDQLLGIVVILAQAIAIDALVDVDQLLDSRGKR